MNPSNCSQKAYQFLDLENDDPLSADLAHILNYLREPLNGLRGERILLTGGMGFFGYWLLESLLWANHKLNLNAQVTALTRNPDVFVKKALHLALSENVTLKRGDIGDCEFPDGSMDMLSIRLVKSLSN